MDIKEITKALVLLFLFFLVAPIAGFLIRKRPLAQKALFFALCFMSVEGFLDAGVWSLTLDPVLYRGHSRGFHFFFAETVAATLIIAQLLGNWRDFKLFPRGLWVYYLYCGAAMLSLINAPFPVYGWMAAVKAVKISLIFIVAYNFLRKEDDMRFFLKAMAWTMTWELFVVLKMKYADHIYQVAGTFEHQNSLSMFATMIGMVLLAAGMGPKTQGANFFLFGYVACAVIVQSTLSRAGLAIFALGSVGVAIVSLVDKPSKRRWYVIGTMTAIGVFGLMMTMKTIVARFNDYGNDESKHTRMMLNEASRHMLRDYPLGIGWNNFAATINHPFPYGNHIDEWQLSNGNPVDKQYQKGVVESLYYLHLAETGYQGLLTYSMIMALFLWWNFRAFLTFRNHFLGCVSIGIAMGCGVIYIQSTLERVLTQERNLILWLLVLAASSRIETWRRIEKRRRRAIFREKKSQALMRRPRWEEPVLA